MHKLSNSVLQPKSSIKLLMLRKEARILITHKNDQRLIKLISLERIWTVVETYIRHNLVSALKPHEPVLDTFSTHYHETCGDSFHTTQPSYKALFQNTACCQPSQRNLYCFPINACRFMRASSHRNIAYKEETDHWSSQQRIPHHGEKKKGERWKQKEGVVERERVGDKNLACVHV